MIVRTRADKHLEKTEKSLHALNRRQQNTSTGSVVSKVSLQSLTFTLQGTETCWSGIPWQSDLFYVLFFTA